MNIWMYILVSAAVSYLIRVTPLVLIRHIVPQMAETGVRRVSKKHAGEVAAAGFGIFDPVCGEVQPDNRQHARGQLFLPCRQGLEPQGADLALGHVLRLA